MNILFERFELPEELRKVIYNSPSVIIPTSKDQLFELIFGNEYTDKIEVLYDVNGHAVKEAEANVEMISEGASDVSLNFVVPMNKVVEVVKILHDKYIGVIE